MSQGQSVMNAHLLTQQMVVSDRFQARETCKLGQPAAEKGSFSEPSEVRWSTSVGRL